jgi:CBS domain-containing protein
MNKPTVGDVYRLITKEAKTIDQNAKKHEVVKILLSGSTATRSVYVVNDIGQLKGIITVGDVIASIAVRTGHIPRRLSIKTAYKLFKLSGFGVAGDMMRAPVRVTKESELQTALEKMADNNLSELPVTDKEGKIIGDLNAFEVLKFI